MPAAQGPSDVHTLPNARTGKGIPLQPLPDKETKDRNCARALPDRETDKNLVPEPSNETEKRTAGCERNKRTGEKGKRRTGKDEARQTSETSRTAAAAAAPPSSADSRPAQDDLRAGQDEWCGSPQSRRH